MERMLDNPALNAAQVLQQLGCSEKYVFRICRECSGKSFGELIEEMRIMRAESLLGTTKMSNEQIAQAAGFASLTTFYRAFKRIHGVTPSVWRTGQKSRKE